MEKSRFALACLPVLFLSIPALADDQGSKTGLFNTRYCEILTLTRNGMKATATVYNTIGFNDCPTAAWNGISKKDATKQLGVDGLDMNGPRYWLIDGIKGKGVSATGKKINVNGIEMGERATLEVSIKQALGGKKLYTPNEVKRDTVFTFRAGKPVFELTDPQGQIYRMQSYSQIVNKAETLDDLAGLGARLKLPKGWSYSTHMLDKGLELFNPHARQGLQPRRHRPCLCHPGRLSKYLSAFASQVTANAQTS